jgi:hypothetical protein
MRSDRFAATTQLADTVLYEGYVLYPYRKSAHKNQLRWNFGVVAPRDPRKGTNDSYAYTDCLVETHGTSAALTIQIRFLQVQRRIIEARTEHGWQAVERLVAGGTEFLSWEEAVPCELVTQAMPLDAADLERPIAFDVAGARLTEEITDAAGSVVARVIRVREPLAFQLRVGVRRASDQIAIVTVRVENTAPADANATQASVGSVARALVSLHALLAIDHAAFLSLLDPPPHAVEAARQCTRAQWWPVLVGDERARDMMLCAPIILYDYPALAPETRGDFFDATEIDELLTLRVLTLTEDEKREVRATDERSRHILDRVEQMTAAAGRHLHGAVRAYGDDSGQSAAATWEALLNPPDMPSPEEAWCFAAGGTCRVRRGDRVRLAPKKGADAMDMFLAGRTATVAGVYHDMDERTHVAVTLDDDPIADLRRDVGRYFYFAPDEVAPIDSEARDG